MKKIIPLLLGLTLLCGCAAPGAAIPGSTTLESTAVPESAAPGSDTVPEKEPVAFSTTDLEGNIWTGDELTAAVTMINFWECWCGPCVREMPDLQKLQEEYGGRGLQILGVFSDASDMAGVESVLESTGVTYPILRYCPEFDRFQTGYVPTTIFLDSEGRILGETIIGAHSYEDWAKIVEELL